MGLSSIYYAFLYEGNQDANVRAQFVHNLLNDSSLSVMDVLAGDGLVGMNLCSRGFAVTLLEEDPVLYAIILEKFRGRKDLNSRLTPLPVKLLNLHTTETWNVIYFSNSISFLDDNILEQYFAKAHELLTENGLLIFNSPLPTKLRYPQDETEIHKKVFGFNVIRHLASSKFLDERTMQIEYVFKHFHSNALLSSISDQFSIFLRSKNELSSLLEKIGFETESIYSDWEMSPIESDSANCLMVARKTTRKIVS